MAIAFKNFKDIEKLEKVKDKHREWLKDYEGLYFSIGKLKNDLVFWQKEKEKYVYRDKLWDGWYCEDFKGNFLYANNINKIQRHKKRLVIEFDDDNAKENLEIVYKKLKEKGWGFIKSTHNSEKSDYLWVEFTKELTEKEAELFLLNITPENSEIDLNFASDKRRYPILFAEHWKYGTRETPIEYFEGEQIDYDSLEIKPKKVEKKVVTTSQGTYETYIRGKEDIKIKIWELLLQKKKPEATELIVEDFLTNNSVYTIRNDEKDEMWIYHDGIYIPDGQSYIKERCDELLGIASTTNLCNQVIFKIETRNYINQEEFFKEEDKNLIAVQNGILNIKTKKLFPFNPTYRFFNKLPMNYIPGKTCPHIIEFFKSTLKDKREIQVIQELFGFLLYREYFLEKAFMFLGEGRNGKGKTIDLMKRFLGMENCSEISLEDLEKDIYSIEELFKKMANLSGDLSRSALKHTGTFKKLTGRDLVSGARKFKTRVNFENYAKMIFACNELPLTYDITTAFFNRWIIIDFPYTFLTQREIDKRKNKKNLKLQDPEIIEKIATPEEMEGLLNWALDGLERLFKNKSFSLSPSTEETKSHWLRKSDSFNGFIMDMIEEDFNSYIIKGDLRQEYQRYCNEFKLKSSSDKAIKHLLETTLGAFEERKTIGEQQKSVWCGISLKKRIEVTSKASKANAIFQDCGKIYKNTETVKPPTCFTSLTSDPFSKFTKKPQNLSESEQAELMKEQMKILEEPESQPKKEVGSEVVPQLNENPIPCEVVDSPVDNKLNEREEFKKKMGEFGF